MNTMAADDSDSPPPSEDQDDKKLSWHRFDNVKMAQGYCLLGASRGAIVMSNIFLATSFIFLASEEAGCLNDSGDDVLEECPNQVYGFKPESFVSAIAVISGVLSALFMPVLGAVVDYTKHRKTVGVLVAGLIIAIQAAQVYTVLDTWFAMAILQAIAGFLYQVEVLATYAYLPDIARAAGQHRMTGFSAHFTMVQFAAQALFLIAIIAISVIGDLGTVMTAQVGQGVNVVWSALFFYLGWRLLTAMPANHPLPEGRSLFTQGFYQVVHTIKDINKRYRRGLRWFLLAVVFAEAAANAFTVVAVIYLDEQIGLSSNGIAAFFLTTLIASLPGSKLGQWVTHRSDPNKSWQLCMLCLFLWSAGGAIVVDHVPKEVSFVWGAGVGVLLGWFYPVEGLFFSMCLPKGQEAELAGFYVYCTQILGWLPPLIFTLLVEANLSQTYAVIAVTAFFLAAIALARCAAPWEEILEESGRSADVVNDKEDAVMQDVMQAL